MRAVPRLCDLYPGICLTTEEKARKNLSQGSRRMPVGMINTWMMQWKLAALSQKGPLQGTNSLFLDTYLQDVITSQLYVMFCATLS